MAESIAALAKKIHMESNQNQPSPALVASEKKNARRHTPEAQAMAVAGADSARREQKMAPRDSPFSERQEAVVEAARWSWKGYETYAFGADELKPISRQGSKWYGVGLTIVDSLDTLLLMGMTQEFERAKSWVQHRLNFDIDVDVNLFEMTIRELGGLLSAFALTDERFFLEKATDLGERLLPAFKTKSGVPYSDVNLRKHSAHAPSFSSSSSLAEVSTLRLEFCYLSHLTKRPEFCDAVKQVSNILAEEAGRSKFKDLLPIYVDPGSGKPTASAIISLGARGDSYYEYLLKSWLQTGRKDDVLLKRYMAAV